MPLNHINSGWISDGVQDNQLKGSISVTVGDPKTTSYVRLDSYQIWRNGYSSYIVILEATNNNYGPGRQLIQFNSSYILDAGSRCYVRIGKDKFVTGVYV